MDSWNITGKVGTSHGLLQFHVSGVWGFYVRLDEHLTSYLAAHNISPLSCCTRPRDSWSDCHHISMVLESGDSQLGTVERVIVSWWSTGITIGACDPSTGKFWMILYMASHCWIPEPPVCLWNYTSRMHINLNRVWFWALMLYEVWIRIPDFDVKYFWIA